MTWHHTALPHRCHRFPRSNGATILPVHCSRNALSTGELTRAMRHLPQFLLPDLIPASMLSPRGNAPTRVYIKRFSDRPWPARSLGISIAFGDVARPAVSGLREPDAAPHNTTKKKGRRNPHENPTVSHRGSAKRHRRRNSGSRRSRMTVGLERPPRLGLCKRCRLSGDGVWRLVSRPALTIGGLIHFVLYPSLRS